MASSKSQRSPLGALGKGVVIALLALLITSLLRYSGALQPLEWRAYDVLLSLSQEGPSAPRDDIVIVSLTKEDEERFGSPLPDKILTALLTKLAAEEPVAIGLDLIRDRPEPSSPDGLQSAPLQEVMRNTDELIGIVKDTEPTFAPAPALVDLDRRLGAADIIKDGDGVVRRGLLYISSKGKTRPTFALQLALRKLQEERLKHSWQGKHLKLGDAIYQPLMPSRTGYYQNKGFDGGYQFLLRYPACSGGFPRYRVQDIIDSERDLDLEGKVVLIGNALELSKDVFTAPIQCGDLAEKRLFGVDLWAHITAQLIDQASGALHPSSTTGQLIGHVELGRWLDRLWIGLWCALGALLVILLRQPVLLGIAAVAVLMALLFLDYAAFSMLGWWLPLIPPAIGFVIAFALTAGLTMTAAQRERDVLHELFVGVTSKRVADTLLQQRTSQGGDRHAPPEFMMATVMFTDIKGFSAISEQLPEPILAEWLNEYLEAMVDIVAAYDGVIEKFAGDGLTIEFGPPDQRTTVAEITADVKNALDTALAMAASLKTLNHRWRERGWPEVGIRIGIHTGQLMAGAVGGTSRFQYSIIGDTANTAARLESYGKDDPELQANVGDCRIFISETTFRYLEDKKMAHLVGTLSLRGKTNQIAVYRIVGRGTRQEN